ncbi:MAG: 4Fe-4S binding protein [Firmicutes bacterium]|nr:4Fe-4S binding protein [Bacillota bacterium]
MAHHTARSGYKKLTERLDRFPHGIVESETLYKILAVMFTEEEARLLSMLPIGDFGISLAQKRWNISIEETTKILDDMASRAVLLDIQKDKETRYLLPPPMIGFFEFSMMRIGTHQDQKVLSELFYEYLCVEDEFVTSLMTLDTPLGRALVREEAIEDKTLYVMDYEKTSAIIHNAKQIGVSTCYCRHVKEHLGTVCDAPMETCLTISNTGDSSLIRHGYAREISKEEALDIIVLAKKHNLVQFAENVQNNVSFICNCCSCCCEVLSNAKKHGFTNAINSSNYICEINEENCIGCSKCVKVCPMDAISLVSTNIDGKKKIAVVDKEMCIGCGVCDSSCAFDALELIHRESRVFTPVNLNQKLILQAIETNKLQHLIFRDEEKISHRVLASVLGVILRLPPAKQLLASKQLKSKYLKKQIEIYNKKSKDVK